MMVGFLSALVLILGFVTQFSSLATFAGFITAGIAVGLQTILLSVAAYFFIVGRYGVRVGDRITVANVTGDVVEVGLVRFYVMELAGTGTEFHPTGRIAVFANSVLFQTGTPLYKQIPGTNYAWHEVTVKLKQGSDYRPTLDVLRKAVEKVYSGYKSQIEQQHTQTETWMDTAMPGPGIQTRLQLSDGLQYAVLYPVQISNAAAIDDQVVQELLESIARDTAVMQVIDGPPAVRAVIKT
jgi:small-conductance mechanosensitive channel